MDPPRDFLTALGRVVVAMAKLEGMLAEVVLVLTETEEEPATDEKLLRIIGSQPLSKLRKLISEAPQQARADLTRLSEDAGGRMDERDRLVHSLALMDTSSGSLTWRAVHPRTGEESDLMTAEAVSDLADQIDTLGARALRLSSRLADLLRTSEGT